MLERLQKMLREAQAKVNVVEELLLESKITADFNPSESNVRQANSYQVRLAEVVNYRNVLVAKIQEIETGVSSTPITVTTETVRNSLMI